MARVATKRYQVKLTSQLIHAINAFIVVTKGEVVAMIVINLSEKHLWYGVIFSKAAFVLIVCCFHCECKYLCDEQFIHFLS